MSPQVWRFIFVISLTHALVHTYELAWPSIEQEASSTFYPTDDIRSKEMSGWLAGIWRMLFGGGSLLVGLLITRASATRWLIFYLVGCGVCSILAGLSPNVAMLGLSLAGMGAFASIYHPAGLGIISDRTTPDQRPMALGIHGILGSLGIAIAPFWAAVWLGSGGTWRTYLIGLGVPGFLLAVIVGWLRGKEASMDKAAPATNDEFPMRPWLLLLISSIAAIQGFVYSAQLSFLPRYLSRGLDWGIWLDWAPWFVANDSPSVQGKFLAAIALLLGCVGQLTSGYFARHRLLEKQLILVLALNIPFLIWMGFARTEWRVVAAGGFALVHFMYQPVYNSLVAKHVAGRFRSFAFGASFAISLGLGSLGAVFAGRFQSDQPLFVALAAVTLIGACVASVMAIATRKSSELGT